MEQTGYIYKLYCDDGHFYFGNTTTILAKRLYSHKQDGTTNPRMSGNRLYSYINSIGWDHVKIILVEEVKFTTKEQLRRAENKYIVESLNNPLCLNSNRSIVTIEERKALVTERSKRIQTAKHLPIECECGMVISIGRKQQHLNSMNHKLEISKSIVNANQYNEINEAGKEIHGVVQ